MHHRSISSSTARTTRRTVLHAALAVPLALGLAGQAAAQSAATAFPSKTIRFVVPYPPGGPTDLMARMLQPELQSRLGVPVVVDNKGGAGGNTGSAEVAKQAPADGHTLLLAASGPMAVNPSLYASMPFNPLTDLAPVIQLLPFRWCWRCTPRWASRPWPSSWPWPRRASRCSALRRQRHTAAPGRGAVQHHGRREDGAHPLPGRRPGAQRSDRWAGERDVRHRRQRCPTSRRAS